MSPGGPARGGQIKPSKTRSGKYLTQPSRQTSSTNGNPTPRHAFVRSAITIKETDLSDDIKALSETGKLTAPVSITGTDGTPQCKKSPYSPSSRDIRSALAGHRPSTINSLPYFPQTSAGELHATS